jgi:dTDP-D-glucose 4,6-dehydratase
MMNKVTIFGHGYVSRFLIETFSRLGWTIVCTSRKIDIGMPIKNENLTLINFFDPALSSILQSSNIILSTVPPEKNVDPVLYEYQDIIAQKKSLVQWIGYLSSTSVYGNHEGSWIDETTPCNPSNEKARCRLEIEREWLNIYESFNLPVHVFRLSGIYGPGRNCLEDIIKGKDFTIVKKDHYFSRIHIEDICQLILKSINYPTPGEIYNISDNEPAPLHVVQQFGAKILGKYELKEIMEEKAKISEDLKKFFMDNKKVNSKKIIKKLGVNLIYPNYQYGLSKGCLPYLYNSY